MILFQDPDREKSLLCRLLFTPQEHMLIPQITEAVFDNQLYRQVFLLIRQLYQKHYVITPSTIEDYLNRNSTSLNNEQIILFVKDLEKQEKPQVSSSEQIQYLSALSVDRQIYHMTNKVASMLQQKNATESIIHYIRKEIQSLEYGQKGESLEETTVRALEKIKYAQEYGAPLIKSGLKGLDEAIGLTTATYLLICGKSGEGKSSLANQLVTNFFSYNNDVSVLYLSMEVERVKLIECFVSNLCHLSKDRLRGKGKVRLTPHEMTMIHEALEKIKSWDLEIEYGAIDAEKASMLIDIFVTKQRLKYGEKRKVAVIADHHLFIQISHSQNQQDAINDFSKMAANKKERLDLLFILLCQMHNRNTEERDANGTPIPPQLKWIQYPGTLKQDCDTSVAIWRKNKVINSGHHTDHELVELYVEKNRDGQPDISIPTVFTGKYGLFSDVLQVTYTMNPGHVDEIPDV